MKNLEDLKKRKEILKKNISEIEEKMSFDNPKEFLSAFTSGLTDQFVSNEINEKGEQKLSINPAEILSFLASGATSSFFKTKISEFGSNKLGINAQDIISGITENAFKLGIAGIVANFAKKNLYHKNWNKKIIGLALIYVAPFLLKFIRKKLDEFQQQETLKSMEKII